MHVDEFPIEVRHLMLYRQQEQHGKRDWSTFRLSPTGGFTFSKTPEKQDFWWDVIVKEKFDVFYDKYPKVDYPKDMPEEIIMLALDRRVKQGWPTGYTLGFSRFDTPENWSFWNEISSGNYSVYYEKYGVVFTTDGVRRFPGSFYKGQLEGFPPEVVELMLQRQFEQTGKRDISVFEANRQAGKSSNGFTWEDTIEGHHFWEDVIEDKNFDVFFKKYPKQSLINSQIKTKQNDKESTTSNKAIEVSTVVATISTGKRPTSVGISGRRGKTTIGSGHLSYKAVFGF